MNGYPVRKSGIVDNNAVLETRFIPKYPGLIKVISKVKGESRRRPLRTPTGPSGVPSPNLGRPGEATGFDTEPSTGEELGLWMIRQRIELFRGESSAPMISAEEEFTASTSKNEFVSWRDYNMSPAELVQDEQWRVRVTNLSGSNMPLRCDITVRYPTISANLGKIDHIVVLMMENRSFDHMLGYLRARKGRTDIDGLNGDESNRLGDDGPTYTVRELTDTVFQADPGHKGDDVAEQIKDNNSGFVNNFSKTANRNEPVENIMGYHVASQVPTYDFLSEEFTVCDRWFCSVPGSTWPNRLYSMAGSSDGTKDNPKLDLNDPAGFELKSIFEYLQEKNVDWMSYFSDLPFALIFKNIAQNADYTEHIRPIQLFFPRAETGDLPSVTWLEPNYADIPEGRVGNDDHPPADITQGQRFVSEVYRALAKSPAWSKTLLIITYDEHGGFYDHEFPQEASDDLEHMKQYGVRVPSFVVSPWVGRRTVSSSEDIYDHTSILKTILLRFIDADDPPRMSARVNAAKSLGPLLRQPTARARIPDLQLPTVSSPEIETVERVRREDDFALVLRRKLFGF